MRVQDGLESTNVFLGMRSSEHDFGLATSWQVFMASLILTWSRCSAIDIPLEVLSIYTFRKSYSSILSSFSQPGFFCKITKPSRTWAKGIYSSVASSARSVVPSRTGVECV